MLLALALLQTSLLARPLYLDAEPPELRSALHIQLLHQGAVDAPASVTRSRKDAEKLAAELVRELGRGADFEELAYRHSDARSGTRGAVLGTFARGMLADALDDFLFEAEVGEFSGPLVTPGGVHVLLRTETLAAVRQVFIEGVGLESRMRADDVLRRARAGESFTDLARRFSDDPSDANGGALAIFERGANDRLLKKAAFEIAVGEVSEPIETPLGLHLLKRVRPSELPSELRESNFIRVRGILVAYEGAVGAPVLIQRTQIDAFELATRVHERILAGEDMGLVAAEINDDPGGRRRNGDLGWVHRGNPDLPVFMLRLFNAQPGQVQPPEPTSAGYVVLRREQ